MTATDKPLPAAWTAPDEMPPPAAGRRSLSRGQSGCVLMDIRTFGAYHLPALLREEVKFSRMVSLVEGAARGDLHASKRWSFGRPGACAMQTPGYPILLADFNKEEIEQLADEVAGTHFVGAAGPY